MFYYFFYTSMKNACFTKSIFLTQKCIDVVRKKKVFFTVKHLTIHMHFNFDIFFQSVQQGTFRHSKSFFWPNNSLFFFNIHEKFMLYQDVTQKCTVVVKKRNLYSNALENYHAFFSLFFFEESFSLFNRAPSNTQKKVSAK